MGDISIFDLKAAQDRVKTPYFIETGTLYGDGVEFAYKQGFEEIHSIEIEPFLAQQAKEKFKAFPNIHIHEGNSFEVLEQILPEIKGNITFWLPIGAIALLIGNLIVELDQKPIESIKSEE